MTIWEKLKHVGYEKLVSEIFTIQMHCNIFFITSAHAARPSYVSQGAIHLENIQRNVFHETISYSGAFKVRETFTGIVTLSVHFLVHFMVHFMNKGLYVISQYRKLNSLFETNIQGDNINMVNDSDKILIRELRKTKGWGAKKLMSEFPDKNWKRTTLNDLLKKIDNTGDVKRNPGSGRHQGRNAFPQHREGRGAYI